MHHLSILLYCDRAISINVWTIKAARVQLWSPLQKAIQANCSNSPPIWKSRSKGAFRYPSIMATHMNTDPRLLYRAYIYERATEVLLAILLHNIWHAQLHVLCPVCEPARLQRTRRRWRRWWKRHAAIGTQVCRATPLIQTQTRTHHSCESIHSTVAI